MSYQRKKEDKKRLKELYKKTKNNYCSGAYFDTKKKRIIRYWISGDTKFWKKHSNKKIRRKFKDVEKFQQKCLYKKIFDYWWTIF